ncbi:hypothetical protein H6761_02495 [Candidatus Nomurabacteria bacterium]|nr:hypothetical protein [Candidatus Nomurabacteria bacterium]
MAEENINLMPEDLRQKEMKANNLSAEQAPDLNIPKKQESTVTGEESGSHGSWMANFANRLNNKQKEKPEIEENNFKPLPVEEKPQENTIPAPIDNTPKPEISSSEDRPIRTSGFELNEVAEEKVEGKFHQPEKNIRARFIDSAEGVDLVPTSAKIKSWKQISTLVITAFVASLGILVVLYFGLLATSTNLSSNQVNKANNIAQIEAKLLEFEDISKEINQTGKEISLVYEALTQHIYWTNFFALLEKYTLNDVSYTGFAAVNNGALTLDAVAPDYYTVAKQLKVLQEEQAQEFVTDVDISAAALTDASVSFNISLTLNPNLFYYQQAK